MKIMTTMVVILAASALAFAQLESPRFEVASVKRAAPEREVVGQGGRRSIPGAGSAQEGPAQVAYRNMSLASLLMRAYHLTASDITGPSWLDSEQYDVAAKMPEGATMDQIPVMLQNLLVERFRISLHWENKEQSGYALEIGRTSQKLKPAEKGQDSDPRGDEASRHADSLSFSSEGHIEIRGTTMAYLATLLSRFTGRPFVDSTALGGTFNIALDVAPEDMAELRQSGASVASISSAVRKLGLQLSPQRVTTRHLVIDRAEKRPTEN